MIGDAVPHGKDEYRNIDWEEELDLLVKMQVGDLPYPLPSPLLARAARSISSLRPFPSSP